MMNGNEKIELLTNENDIQINFPGESAEAPAVIQNETEENTNKGEVTAPSETPGDQIEPPSETETEEAFAASVMPENLPVNEKAESSNVWLWVVFAVVFVVLVAVAGLLVFLKLRKQPANGKKRARANRRKVDRDGATEAIDDTFMEGMEGNPEEFYARPNTAQMTEAAYVQQGNVYSVGVGQTIGKRGNQEDSFAWSNPQAADSTGLLAVVADGVGGLNNGQVASNTAVRVMCSGFERQDANREMSDRLLELAAMAQNEVVRINRQGERCGSTLVTVLVQNGTMVMLSIGDSRIALYRGGMLMTLNREHVLGKELDELSALGKGDPNDKRKRNAITAYIGKENLKTVDRTIAPMPLVPGDRILLMSDGVFGTVSDDIMIDAVANYDVDTAAKAIISAVDAYNLPHQDNATIVIVGVD